MKAYTVNASKTANNKANQNRIVYFSGIKLISNYIIVCNNRMPIKWIGFDMDNCIANITPLTYFIKEFGYEPLIEPLIKEEKVEISQIFRDNIFQIVHAVADAYKQAKITGAFIYSNNSGIENIAFCRDVLNRIAQDYCGVQPFMKGFSRNDVGRDGSQDKSWSDLMNCFHVYDLPPPSNKESLLYFDDMNHILASEIPHYVIVEKFTATTDLVTLSRIFHSVFFHDFPEMYTHALNKTAHLFNKYRFPTVTHQHLSAEPFLSAIERFTSVQPYDSTSNQSPSNAPCSAVETS